MSILGLLILVIIVCLVFWAVRMLTAAFGLPAPVVAVIYVVMVVFVVLYLVQMLGGGSLGLPAVR